MKPVRKVFQKVNTSVLSLLIFDENRKNMKFKVLISIVYCIMDNFVCVDYICWQEKKLYVTNKGQVFENRTYNDVSGVGIPELLMNIIWCHVFLNNTNSDVILSCRRKLVDYYLQMLFSKTI